MRSLTIRQQLLLCFLALATVAAVLLLSGYPFLTRLVELSRPVVPLAQGMRELRAQSEFAERVESLVDQVLVVGSPESRQRLRRDVEHIHAELVSLENPLRHVDSEGWRRLLERLDTLQAQVDLLIRARQGQAPGVDLNRQSLAVYETIAGIKQLNRALQGSQSARLNRIVQEHNEVVQRALRLFYVGAVLVVLLAVVLAAFLSRLLGTGLSHLERYTQRIGRMEPLQADPCQSLQEFGSLVASLDRIDQEIRQRETVQRRLRETVSLLQATLDATTDGIVVMDLVGRVRSYNQNFKGMWSIPEELLVTGDDPAVLSRLEQCLKDPESFRRSLRHLEQHPEVEIFDVLELTDGRVFECFVRPQVIDAEIVGRVWSFRDVTERRQAAREKKQLQDQLRQKQKLEAMGTLAGGIAHDFNNILMAILGYTDLAREDLRAGGGPQVADHLEQVHVAAQRARELVKQILTFSRKTDGQTQCMEVGPIVKEAMKMFRASTPSTVDVVLDLPRSTHRILADPTQIHQVLVNLYTNALHATEPTGGRIVVRLENHDIERTEVTAWGNLPPGRYVRLTVSDTGVGMTPEVRDRIFEPFFTTKEVDQGTGMGLSVVHGIVERCGGLITVDSRPGQGATFTVTLPAAPEMVAVAQSDQGVPEGRGERVLLVDDEPAIVSVLAKALRRSGYEVVEARGAVAALEVFRREESPPVDVVVTDYAMPVMNGCQLAQEIHRLRPDVPVVLCTGYHKTMNDQALKAAGIARLLVKPVSREALAAALRQCLDRREVCP